jgi:hypothetical protein
MKLKMDEAGHVVVSDGKPVYVKDDGSEVAFDVAGTVATISRLNGEAKGHRERAEAAERSLKAFDGINDPALARKAMETYANLDAKKLIDAGEVERVKSQIATAYEEKLTAAEKRAQELEASLYGEKIGGAFARSKFITDKIAVPADMVQATFGKAFKLEDGKVVAYDAHGQKILSNANPGEIAGFDEALERLVAAYPYKEHILKGTGGVGSGGKPSAVPGSKILSNADFQKMAPKERADFMAKGGKLSD